MTGRVRCAWLAGGIGLASLLFAACGADLPEPHHQRPSLLATVKAAPVFTSPATWRYHPQKEAKLLARRVLGDGRVLFAGERGERWVADAKGRSVRTAARLAPEALVAILRLKSGDWLFVGRSGTGYEAKTPLGSFFRANVPLDHLARVTAAGSTLMGVRRDGALVRSADAGATWQTVGPKSKRFGDVELDAAGHGLAIEVPEKLWRTDDAGATWKVAGVRPFGAFSVVRDAKGEIYAHGALGWRRWQAQHLVVAGAPKARDYSLPVRPPRGPDAAAVAAGRAIVTGGRYIQVSHADGETHHPWRLLSGPPAGPLKSHPLKLEQACSGLQLAGFEHWLYLACPDADSASLLIERSDDGGRTWSPEHYFVRAHPDAFAMAVGAGGALLVTGICAEQNSSRGCAAEGVYYRRPWLGDAGAPAAGKKTARRKHSADTDYEFAPSATPALAGAAGRLAYSSDGRVAYAIGRRTKDNHFAVFVSRDGGHTFQAREIDQLPAGSSSYAETRYPWQRRATYQIESVTAAENGALAIVFQRYGRSTLVVTDDEGHTLSVASPPSADAEIGAVGTRALAVDKRDNDAWESLDGGATWNPIELPSRLCSGESACDVSVRCYLGGCMIGDELSRIGWRGQSDDQPLLGPPEGVSPDLYDRVVRTPLSCTLDDVPWRPLPGVSRVPGASQAELGKVVWFAPTSDDSRAAAGLFHAYGGAHPRVEHVTLLAPARRPETKAYMMTPQIEGAAALRYTIPEAHRGAPDLRDVEVAWENLFEGRLVHAHMASAGGYEPGDFVAPSGRALQSSTQHAEPALLSIASGGIYLRVHARATQMQRTYFLDGRRVVSLPPVSWPAISLRTEPQMIHVGKDHMPVLFVGQGAGVVGARSNGSSWRLSAFSTGLVSPTDFGLGQAWDLTYLHDRSGLYLTLSDASDSVHEGWFFAFQASGNVVAPPVPVPTQLDAHDRPRRCNASDRADTPRIIAPWQPGTRHPVVVTDATEPLRVLLTDSAVMFGTASSPCTAAFDATAVPLQTNNGQTQSEKAILPIAELRHSWLFRVAADPTGHGSRVEYRTMNCRFDATAEIPPEVYNLQGTKVLRR